jgi:alkylation response protein AidB-like acyl-CoA dehydrogenase
MIDFTITEDEQLIRDVAMRFGREQLGGEAERRHEAAQAYPDEIHARYEQMGLSALNVPDSGMEIAHRIAVWGALAESDPAAPFALDPVGPGGAVLSTLPEGKGVIIADSAVSRTGTTLSGTVAWVARDAIDWLVLLDADGVWLVLNPATEPIPNRTCGLQACGALQVHLDGTEAKQIGDAEQSVEALCECRCLAATVLIGAARDAHNSAAVYTQERVAFGKPIAHHQGLAFQLADAATEIMAAQLLLEAAGCDAILMANAHAFAAKMAPWVCERSVQALGGHGYLTDHPVEKRMRDVQTIAAMYGGAIASELDAARGILGLSDPMGLTP